MLTVKPQERFPRARRKKGLSARGTEAVRLVHGSPGTGYGTWRWTFNVMGKKMLLCACKGGQLGPRPPSKARILQWLLLSCTEGLELQALVQGSNNKPATVNPNSQYGCPVWNYMHCFIMRIPSLGVINQIKKQQQQQQKIKPAEILGALAAARKTLLINDTSYHGIQGMEKLFMTSQ